MTRRRHFIRALIAIAAAALILVPVVALAAPGGPSPGQRIDLKVLLLTPTATDSGFAAWKETLSKLGVPYDTYDTSQSAEITDAQLANYTTNHANYQAVILASSGVALSTAERAAVDRLETTFGVREISDNTNPDGAHGATLLGSGDPALLPGLTGTLTDAGKAAFPYLKGNVPLQGPSFAAWGTPGPSFTSLVNGSSGGSLMGVWKRDNGTEQLVDGIPGNGQQSHYQLLRFGMLNWATRGVYLGYWRNYFEVQVDDLFLGDDAWDPATHSNNYDPALASRMLPSDLTQALTWSQANNFRLDFAYNAGGHFEYETEHGAGSDTLWTAFSAGPQFRSGFGFVNHTYDHAFLGCSSAPFITAEITKNVAAGITLGLPVNSAELVTGEHSGLANTKPGNPGVLDPPSFDTLSVGGTGGTIPAGSYDYAVTVSNAHGQTSTPEPISTPAPLALGQTVTADVSMICQGTTYALYRRTSAIPTTIPATPAGSWTLAAQVNQLATTPTDNGATNPANPTETAVRLIDTGIAVAPAANVAAAPPTGDTAVMDPYPMNAHFTAGLAAAGVTATATDASKAYPIETSATVPTPVATLPQNPAGAAFNLLVPGGAVIHTVPRYPTNVYYNASTQGQELDEYNWIYTSPPTGGCVPIVDVTTCNAANVTWDQYLASERNIVFGHITGNDPRPHYAHQSNLAAWNPALLETDPLQGGVLYPYLDNILGYYRTLYADNAPITQLSSSAISAALTQQQAWAANVAAGRVSGYIQDDKMHIITSVAMSVPVTGTMQGDLYAGSKSTWLPVAAGETILNLKDPIVNPTAPVTVDVPVVTVPKPIAAPVVVEPRAKQGVRPALTQLKMSTRTFAAARKGLKKSRSQSKITWKLNRVATVRLVVQRKMVVKGKKASWLTMGTITKKNAKVGKTQVTFTGKIGSRTVSKGTYRIVATATAGAQRSAVKNLTFTIVKR